MREQDLAGKQPDIRGALHDVISKISARPNGRALAAVLKSIEPDLGSVNVRISSDMRRAMVSLANGKLATVRVSSAKPARLGGTPVFRFKTPTDVRKYDELYFGGVASDDSAIVFTLTPNEIGRLKTITLKCAISLGRQPGRFPSRIFRWNRYD
jgi:hypothetical protein